MMSTAYSIKVRFAQVEDVGGVENLLRSLPGVWQDTWRPDCILRGIHNSGGLAFLAEFGGQIIGFISAHDVGFRAYISEFAIAEEWQGKGVGTLLLTHVENQLSANNCALVIADVFPPAEGFYLKRQWGHPKAILMSRRLRSVRT